MKAGQPKPAEEFRMSGKEFDRIMGRALQVKPKAQKPKPKRATARKKRSASKKGFSPGSWADSSSCRWYCQVHNRQTLQRM